MVSEIPGPTRNLETESGQQEEEELDEAPPVDLNSRPADLLCRTWFGDLSSDVQLLQTPDPKFTGSLDFQADRTTTSLKDLNSITLFPEEEDCRSV